MSAELVIAGYLRIAKQDLEGARLLNRAENRNAAYLCEQAAEKLIRAVLTSEGIQAGVRHELPDMVSKLPDENPMKPALRAIEHLDAYATAYRYPSPRGRVKPPPDARRAGRGHHQTRRCALRARGTLSGRPVEAGWPRGSRGCDSLSRRVIPQGPRAGGVAELGVITIPVRCRSPS